MKVKSIRGSIKYDGTVYDEGQEFKILDTDFNSLQENVEVVSTDKQKTQVNKSDENNAGESEDTQDTVLNDENTENIATNYSKMKKIYIPLPPKKDELVAIAKEKDIEFNEKTTKDELVSLLENYGK